MVPAGAGGELGAAGVDTDAQLVALWLAQRPEATRRAYAADLAWWRRHGLPLDLRALRLAHIQLALELGKAAGGRPASFARRVAALRSLLAWGHRVGYLTLDVGALVRPGRVPVELAERILEPDEIARLLAAAGDAPRQGARNHLLIRIAYVAGARVAELCGLDWAHVHASDDGGAILTLHGKGGQTRHVWVTPATWRELQDFQAPRSGPIFRAQTGKRLSVRDAERLVEAAAKRAKLGKVSPHWLRHAHATHALERGAPIHEVAAQLGHASVSTTSRYLHVRPGPGSARWLGL
jgi:integrase/recombinase XerD